MARGTKNGAKSGWGTTAMTRSSSISMASTTSRADYLRQVPAAVRLISAEPLLGPVDQLSLDGLHWVITGGESGAGHRRCDPAWVTRIPRARWAGGHAARGSNTASPIGSPPVAIRPTTASSFMSIATTSARLVTVT